MDSIRYIRRAEPPVPYDCGTHKPSCPTISLHVATLLRIPPTPDWLAQDPAYGEWWRQVQDETAAKQATDTDWLREMRAIALASDWAPGEVMERYGK